jgi:hypothetical protein
MSSSSSSSSSEANVFIEDSHLRKRKSISSSKTAKKTYTIHQCEFCKCRYTKPLDYETLCSIECGMGEALDLKNGRQYNYFEAEGLKAVKPAIHRLKDEESDSHYWSRLISLNYSESPARAIFIRNNIIRNLEKRTDS